MEQYAEEPIENFDDLDGGFILPDAPALAVGFQGMIGGQWEVWLDCGRTVIISYAKSVEKSKNSPYSHPFIKSK